jgi:hypothetical protein
VGRNCIVRLVTFTAILIVLFAALIAPAAARAQQAGLITLKLEAGYDSYFRSNKWVPLLISVSNNGPDISGDLRVTASGTSGLLAGAFKTPVELATNSSKQVFLYITLAGSALQVKVELANESGVIADVIRSVKRVGPSDLLYGVITESPRGTIDLTGVTSGIGSASQANWRIDSVPRNAEGLSALDVIVLTDVDSGNLTTDQRRALADWVTSGGHLVVTGGPNWQKTQAGVTDLLPLKPDRTTTLTSLPSIAAFAGRVGETLDAPAGTPIIVAQGSLAPGARVLVEESGIPLLIRRTFGGGVVDYLAADPGLEPYQSWHGRDSFWFTLFTTDGLEPSWSNGIVNPGRATFAANLIKGLRLPDVFQLCGFLAIYIIIIGPLNYLVLKRLGRRELAWLTIPLTIVTCSSVAYLTGFSLRGTQATLNRLALVQVWPGADYAQVDGVIGVLAPRRAVYDLSVDSSLTLAVPGSDPGVSASSGNITIQEDLTYTARRFPVDAGLTAVFSTSGYIQTPALDGNATIRLAQWSFASGAPSAAPPRVTGKVKNTTGMTLYNVVALALGGYQELGTLEPGAEQSFDFPMSAALTPPLSLGSVLKSGYYASTTYSGPYTGGVYSQNRTIQDIMGKNYSNLYRQYALGYGDTPEQQEWRRRQALLEAVVANSEPNGGRGTNVYIAGWSGTSPIKVGLQGASFTTEDTTLYMYRLPVEIVASSDDVEVPPSLLTWTSTDASTRRDAIPYSLNVQPGEHLVFRYNPLPSIRLKQVTGLKLDLTGQNINRGVVFLWDWQAGQWVDVNATSASNLVIDAFRYVGPENAVEMAIEAKPGQALASYDRIDLTLYGRLADEGPGQSQG